MNFEEFINKMIELHDFGVLTQCFRSVPPNIIYEYGYAFGWGNICESYELEPYELETYCQYFNNNAWTNCCHYQRLSEEFMYRHYNNLDWTMVCTYQHLTEQFMEISFSHLNWGAVSRYQDLSEEFLRRHKNNIHWDQLDLSKYDQHFIMEHIDYIGWYRLPKRTSLSEWYIRECYDLIDWGSISKYQCMSEDFIREFENELNFGDVILNSQCHLSANFIARYAKKIGVDYWKINKDKIEERYGKEFWNNYAILN